VHTHEDAFYVVNLAEVAAKYAEWVAALPRVRPFYAVKCNDDPRIIETLARLGTGMDCASKNEMAMALQAGVRPEDIIFAHPAKQVSHLRYASSKGVKRMTFDNEDELRKIAAEYPGAELVMRILTDDSASVCRLGLKFGAPLGTVKNLLTTAAALGAKVVGVSYHVGSGNGSADSFAGAVAEARQAFDIAASIGMPLRLLDIGGGFPGSELGVAPGTSSASIGSIAGATGDAYSSAPSFTKIASAIAAALEKHFPVGCGVELIAEPGRFFVKSSHALAVSIVGKRRTADEATGRDRINYYVNDGLYGSFNCVVYDHAKAAVPLLLTQAPTSHQLLQQQQQRPETDDAIARLGPDGMPVATDIMGLMHAADLRDAVAPRVNTQRRRRIARAGGGYDLEIDDDLDNNAADGTVMRASAGGGGGVHGAFFASAPAAHGSTAIVGGNGNSSSSGLRTDSRSGAAAAAPARRFSYAAASTPVPSASAVPNVFPTTIWGPTCDSFDKISDEMTLPELPLGSWMVFENMGAYTIAGSCRFNGFPLSSKVYINTDGSVDVTPEEVTP